MKKTQLMFENFIIGFLFTIVLISSVFLFLSSGTGGLDIDLFNRTIFSEPQSGIDYVYLTIFEDGNINDLDETEFSFNDEDFTVSYSGQRTLLPYSEASTSGVDVIFSVSYEDCSATSCNYINSNESITELNTFSNIGRSQKKNYVYAFTKTPYADCNSNIKIAVYSQTDYVPEDVLDNNEYTFEIPYCFYPRIDLSITSAVIVDDFLEVSMSNENQIVPFKLKIEALNDNGEYEEIDFDYFFAEVNAGSRATVDYDTIIQAPENTNFKLFFDLTSAKKTSNSDLINELISTSACSGNLKISIDYEPEENIFYYTEQDFEYDNNGLPILSNGEIIVFYETGFDKIIYDINGEQTELWTNIYNSEGEVTSSIPVSLTHDINNVHSSRNYDILPISWFENSYTPLSGTLTAGVEDQNRIIGSGTSFSTQLSEGSVIRVNNVYYIVDSVDSDSTITVNKEISEYFTGEIGEFSSVRTLKSDNGINCVGEVVGDDICYCPISSTVTELACASGTYFKLGDASADCSYERTLYDLVCEGVVVSEDLVNCEELEGCTCEESIVSESCSCTVQSFNDYLLCESSLSYNQVIESYYTKNVINDADYSNNNIQTSINWCVI